MRVILYEGQKHSTNEIQQILGYNHSYLYRIAGDEKRIKRMDIDKLKEIADLESLNPEELREKMLEYAKRKEKLV